MADPTITVQAHCKLLLHAAKYPHAAVNGILLAEDCKGKESSKGLKYVDCVPLFHVSLGLSPMLEIALLQIDAYCKGKGLVIAGYYQANENYNDNEINHVASTIGKKIKENFHDGYLLVVDNRKVKSNCVSQPYKVFTLKENGWKEVDKKGGNSSEDELQKEECLEALLMSGEQRKLRDFDNHLDDVRNDWRNLEVNDMIKQLT
ncbi:ER membrane protein complex subunit 8 [Biomphalaria glabrata]|uniref:ER membrane protein complex subunit 8-like n=1 Tax=Biomphalaria glabrata TaxID=6526 RepID=A0A9W3B0J2_BIOGL|nr:ER membrane protein complex subunit 8-like [Biomphalaria glabrata]KAI8763282.1 ER membrane protein complex subunit 8-like [Biomphalaria glabrata]KAI8791055.1 ER membrane protein complex subunit 8 [Biomphalaria glabrata]